MAWHCQQSHPPETMGIRMESNRLDTRSDCKPEIPTPRDSSLPSGGGGCQPRRHRGCEQAFDSGRMGVMSGCWFPGATCVLTED